MDVQDAIDTTPSASASRPYRSHKFAACDRCRRRKARCMITVLGQPCNLCRKKQLPCSVRETELGQPKADQRRRTRRQRCEADVQRNPSSDASAGIWHDVSPSQGSLIVGPAVAEDVQVLEAHLSSRRRATRKGVNAYRTISATPSNPIIYLTVPRRREGLQIAKDPGRGQLETLEQILGPSQEELLKIFFEHAHPYFPILDENSFDDLGRKDNESLSPALLCETFTMALTWWNHSDVLKQRPRPNGQYIANQAIAALQDDFMAPSMATVCAALLNLTARPTKSVTDNILTAGRMIALAHSLGLNRNPSSWALPANEKALRIRLWWGVIIHDYWSSYAHGTPPVIANDRYDVPLPQPAVLAASGSASEARRRGHHSFRQLCLLTRVLGQLLPLIYTLDTDWGMATASLRRAESALDEWEINVKYVFGLQPETEAPSGHCSLWLAYLSLRVLVQRLYLKIAGCEAPWYREEAEKSRLAHLREATISIVDFTISLQPEHFQEFWLPYSSHFLVMTTTMLLRCMIETQDPNTANQCHRKLAMFQDALQRASSDWNWDIADICLERCTAAISRIAGATANPTQGVANDGLEAGTSPRNVSSRTSLPEPDLQQPRAASTSDLTDMSLYLPADSLDFPWGLLLDSVEGISNFT